MNSFQSLAIFISGAGSNAKNLISFFSDKALIKIRLVVSEKVNPELEEICNKHSIDFITITKLQIADSNFLIDICQKRRIQWVVLAGYLKKIPLNFIEAYPNQIINIHPSLLPKFGGKGMYGDYVHQAVINSNETYSGISIHLVNEEYDKGQMIAQFSIEIDPTETVESLRQKIRQLEHSHYPLVIQNHILKGEN